MVFSQPFCGSRQRRIRIKKTITVCYVGAAAANQVLWICTNPFPSSLLHPTWLTKKFFRIIRHLIPHHVIRGPSQFVAQCFDGYYPIGFCLFALIESFRLWTMSNGKVRCFHVCPWQKLVAVLLVVFALLFAIGKSLAFYTPTIRSVVSDFRKTMDISPVVPILL